MEQDEKTHHVAWADRIGLNKVWARNILDCNENFGKPTYPNSVRRLQNSMINIRNGPQLKTIIDIYTKTILNKWKTSMINDWKNENIVDASNPSRVRSKTKDINYESMKMLYNYIVQTLEDNGFGFYESNLDVDDVGLDD